MRCCRAASRCTRSGPATTSRCGSTAPTCRAGYGWSFPADGELRIGVGSFDPRFHVREPTVRLADDLDADTVRYQGNWIPHALRDATEDGVFFVGDSAGHCLPLTAEGIRTALYFGLACGRELRAVIEGRQTPRAGARPLPRVLGRATRRPFRWMLRVQRLIPRVAPRVLGAVAARDASASGSSTGRSGTTCGSPIRTSRRRARARAAAGGGLSGLDGVLAAPAGRQLSVAAAALPDLHRAPCTRSYPSGRCRARAAPVWRPAASNAMVTDARCRGPYAEEPRGRR